MIMRSSPVHGFDVNRTERADDLCCRARSCMRGLAIPEKKSERRTENESALEVIMLSIFKRDVVGGKSNMSTLAETIGNSSSAAALGYKLCVCVCACVCVCVCVCFCGCLLGSRIAHQVMRASTVGFS